MDYVYVNSGVNVFDHSTEGAETEAKAIQTEINSKLSNLPTFIGELIINRNLINGAASDPAALAFKDAAISDVNNIIGYFEDLNSSLEDLIAIGYSESAVAESDDVQTWIDNNLTDLISGLKGRLSKLEADDTQSKLLTTLSKPIVPPTTTNIYLLLGNPETNPVNIDAAITADFTIITTVSSLMTLVTGQVDLLIIAIDAPGVVEVTLDLLETTNNPLFNRIKDAISQASITLPSSSAMAGIYARVDASTGVWKAPANVSVSYVVKPSVFVDKDDQAEMNVTSTGKSVNAIRSFTGKGTIVWGARTLAGNDNEWRYISVRRFFNFVEESVSEATDQFVFEPNDANTWVRIRAMIENFLILQWKAGALAGSKPEQAFYVRVGLGQTMTAQDILEGNMIVEIGMAAVRPAEFIVLKFSHKMQEA